MLLFPPTGRIPASTNNVGQTSRLPGRAKRGFAGAKAAPFGAAGQARRLPYSPGATSAVVVLRTCAPAVVPGLRRQSAAVTALWLQTNPLPRKPKRCRAGFANLRNLTPPPISPSPRDAGEGQFWNETALLSPALPRNLPFLHNVSHWKSTNVFPTCLKLGFPGYGAQGAHKVRRILSSLGGGEGVRRPCVGAVSGCAPCHRSPNFCGACRPLAHIVWGHA